MEMKTANMKKFKSALTLTLSPEEREQPLSASINTNGR
jgi:hypothetical protein